MGIQELEQGRKENHALTIKKCKDCWLDCGLKSGRLRLDGESCCCVPEAQQHALNYNHPVINNDVLFSLAARTLKRFGHDAATKDNPRYIKDYFDMQMKFKETFYPEVQKMASINIQIDAAQEIIDAFLKPKK